MTDDAALEVTRGGEVTEPETAAIVAAASVLLSTPQVALRPEPPSRWRFSGRWWVKPVPLRRRRP